jgi:choline dehydrogenase-like flavoprotein
VVIVGAGAAGIFLAVKLTRAGCRTLLIESGHLQPDENRQALNEIEQTGKILSNARWTRKRVVGGTTTAWGGQALPFGELDFEPRDWVRNSGWPISRRDLEPYYREVASFMGLDDCNFDSDLFARLGMADPRFDPSVLAYHYSKWAPQPNFHTLQASQLQKHIPVLYNAHVVGIDVAESGRVQRLTVSNFHRQQLQVFPARVILAAGGLETNRILLLNDHQQAGGLGNHSGWLGKAFMEHPCVDIGVIHSADERNIQRLFASRLKGRRKYGVRLSATRAWQQTHRLLNVSAGFLFRYENESFDPYFELRQLVRQHRADQPIAVLRKIGALVRGIATFAHEGFIYKPGAEAGFSLLLEQEPLRESHVSLGSSRDFFGARLARLHWHVSELTWHTAVRFAHEIKNELERRGLGRVTFRFPLREDDPAWVNRLSDVNHHMGGTRMSSRAADGVVAPNLSLWKTPNLYLCSASVFPTSSHSNPTFTLLALAARLGAEILNERAAAAPVRVEA